MHPYPTIFILFLFRKHVLMAVGEILHALNDSDRLPTVRYAKPEKTFKDVFDIRIDIR